MCNWITFTRGELVFKHGSSLEAVVVFFSTGCEPIKNTIRDMFGDEVTTKVTLTWGFDEEGESRRAYTPSVNPGASSAYIHKIIF